MYNLYLQRVKLVSILIALMRATGSSSRPRTLRLVAVLVLVSAVVQSEPSGELVFSQERLSPCLPLVLYSCSPPSPCGLRPLAALSSHESPKRSVKASLAALDHTVQGDHGLEPALMTLLKTRAFLSLLHWATLPCISMLPARACDSPPGLWARRAGMTISTWLRGR